VTREAVSGVPATHAEGGYYVEPGVTVLLDIPSRFFCWVVGVEIIPGGFYESQTWTSILAVLAAHGQFGLKF
jgi:hypothetical protein